METTKNEKPLIIVAEDEEYNFLLIKEYLDPLNCGLLHARDGKEALALCEREKNIALVLMDIKMPFIDGHSLARLLKTERPQLPIVAQTAYALEHEIARYSDAFDEYLVKPIDEDELLQIVSYYLSKR